MDEERQEELVSRIDKADRGIKAAVGSLVALIVIMLIVVIIQLFSISDQVQATVAQVRLSQLANQQAVEISYTKTQAYVVCITTALTTPITDRKASTLNTCTDAADKKANN